MADFNALMIFAAVVEAKSFSEAARRLKMPLASVSRRVADLEHQLGVRLLERSTRSLRLTEVGAEVLEHAQRSSEICEAVDNIVSNHQAQRTAERSGSIPEGPVLLETTKRGGHAKGHSVFRSSGPGRSSFRLALLRPC